MKRLKILWTVILVIGFTLSAFATSAYVTYTAYKADFIININERLLTFERPVVAIRDNTYIPLRELCDELGYGIEWNSTEKKIDIIIPVEEHDNYVQRADTAEKIGLAILMEKYPDFFEKEYFVRTTTRAQTWLVCVYDTNPAESFEEYPPCVYVNIGMLNGQIYEIGNGYGENLDVWGD